MVALNKVAFVDIPFHKKTKSSQFFINLLTERYQDVALINCDAIHAWKEEDYYQNLKVYDTIIFWQIIYPHRSLVERLQDKNIVFCPMFDQVAEWGYIEWYYYNTLKILCFSKTLYDRLKSYNLDCIYIQYFPPPLSRFNYGNRNKAFFWQRKASIDAQMISGLFDENMAIHVHKALDPGEKYVSPNAALTQERLRLSYTTWFKSKEDYLRKIDEAAIYVAPRSLEGIGMSFLEAMGMGKCVVALNRPTMNEYIKSGQNGMLYDRDGVQQLDFSNIREMQQNAFETVKNGYDRFNERLPSMFEFIEEIRHPITPIFELPPFIQQDLYAFRDRLYDLKDNEWFQFGFYGTNKKILFIAKKVLLFFRVLPILKRLRNIMFRKKQV